MNHPWIGECGNQQSTCLILDLAYLSAFTIIIIIPDTFYFLTYYYILLVVSLVGLHIFISSLPQLAWDKGFVVFFLGDE